MAEQNLESQFNDWAPTYDRDVRHESGFPFAGYEEVLDRAVDLAQITAGMELLELGAGTGNLTRKLLDAGATVWALDFSSEMLAIARRKAPEAHFGRADLLSAYPPEFRRKYSRIVSTYTFHEFTLINKVTLICRLFEDYLTPNGAIVIGDIGFIDMAALKTVKKASGEAWDDEYYWIQDEAIDALRSAGFYMSWEQISSCGVVLKITQICA